MKGDPVIPAVRLHPKLRSGLRCCSERNEAHSSQMPIVGAPVTAPPALGEMGLEREEKTFPSTRNKYLRRQFSSQEKEKVRRSHEMPVRTMVDMIEGRGRWLVVPSLRIANESHLH
jgi:hypothetical protein